MNKDLLLKYLKELKANLLKLRDIKISDIEELKNNIEKQWSVLHGLQIIIQGMLDIGNGILSHLSETDVDTYKNIILKLGEHKIIPVDFANDIKEIAGFRNIIVHGYISINMDKVYSILTNKLDDIDTFIKYINEYSEKMEIDSKEE